MCFCQGDVELPEVPSEPLPEAPEKKPGLFSHQVSLLKTRRVESYLDSSTNQSSVVLNSVEIYLKINKIQF